MKAKLPHFSASAAENFTTCGNSLGSLPAAPPLSLAQERCAGTSMS
jgi:hypothetical protein